MGSMGFIDQGPGSNFPKVTDRVNFFDDFFEFFSVATTNVESGKWTISGVNTETMSISDAANGVIALATGGADDDDVSIQSKAEVLAVGSVLKRPWRYAVRFKCDEATQSELLMGFVVKDTTLLGSGISSGEAGASDFVAFMKDDGDANIDLVIRTASGTVQRVAAIGTFVVDTWIELAFEVVCPDAAGTGIVRAWIDGQPVALSGGSYDLASTVLPTTELCVTCAMGAGDGASNILSIDAVEASWPRR